MIACLNLQKEERLRHCIRLYSDIRSLLTPSSFKTILMGDLMMATLNKSVDIRRIDIVLTARKHDMIPDEDIAERIMNTLLLHGNLKSFTCVATDRYNVRLNNGGFINLQFKTNFDLVPCCNIASVLMKDGVVSIDPRSLKAFASLKNLAVSPTYLMEDALIAVISDINSFKLRSHYFFSKSGSSVTRQMSDWHVAKMLYRYIFKYDFKAWQGIFPIFVAWPSEVTCCLCLSAHGKAVIQTCGHRMHASCGYRYHSFASSDRCDYAAKTCPICRNISFIKTITVVDSV